MYWLVAKRDAVIDMWLWISTEIQRGRSLYELSIPPPVDRRYIYVLEEACQRDFRWSSQLVLEMPMELNVIKTRSKINSYACIQFYWNHWCTFHRLFLPRTIHRYQTWSTTITLTDNSFNWRRYQSINRQQCPAQNLSNWLHQARTEYNFDLEDYTRLHSLLCSRTEYACSFLSIIIAID